MPGKKVEFCEGTKPPNQGAMKILTTNIKKDPPKIKKEPTKIIDIINTMIDTPYNKDILLIMSQTNVTRKIAEKVYEECDEDLVNSIMYIVEETSV
jgi:NACalpha-BTF3-like transcription factor